MPTELPQENKQNIAVLQKEVRLEIKGLKDALNSYSQSLKEVTSELRNIFNKLNDFVVTHKGLSDEVAGIRQTSVRHNNEIIEVKKNAEEHEKVDEDLHDEVKEFMTQMKTYAKVAGVLTIPLYGQFVSWIWNVITK